MGSGDTVIEPSFGRTMNWAISKIGDEGLPTSRNAPFSLALSESWSSSSRMELPGSDLDILWSNESILPPVPFSPDIIGVWIQVALVQSYLSATSRMYMCALRWSIPPNAMSTFSSKMSAACRAG